MSLIEELRAKQPQIIADVFEAALNQWPTIEAMLRKRAARGYRYALLRPEDGSPAGRAVCAAVAAKAESEGFRVMRIKQEPDAMAVAMGASSDSVVWKVSW